MPRKNQPTMIDISKLQQSLNGRTLDEALAYLEICKQCSKYRNTICTKDEVINKEQQFIQRLATGFCREKWDKRAYDVRAFHFFTTDELAADSYKLLCQIPYDIDLLLGVSRSGLIPASVLSMQLHIPMMTISKNSVAQAGSGWRLQREQVENPSKILVVDDTLYSGRSLSIVKEVVEKFYPNSEILTCAVYVHPKSIEKVDFYVEMLPGRHYLEWNFFNSIAVSRCIYDFDGILCEDIAPQDDDDGERYIKALQNAIPKYLVRREPIPIIVTARLEKYRELTLQWLKKWKVSCKKLIMGPWKNNRERGKRTEISKFKAAVYSSYHQNLFVESDPLQAREICEMTGKEVLCPKLKRVLVK